MNKTALVLCTSLLVISTASDAHSGAFFEGSLGWAHVEKKEMYHDLARTDGLGNNGVMMGAALGYMVSPCVGMEVGFGYYPDVNKMDAGAVGDHGRLTNNFLVPVAVKLQRHFGHIVPYMKVAAVFAHTKLEGPGPYSTIGGRQYNLGTYNRVQLGLSLGAQYEFSTNSYIGIGGFMNMRTNPVPDIYSLYATVGYMF